MVVQSENKQSRFLAGTITLLFHAALILFLIWKVIITPIPPFPDEGGIELGVLNYGTSDAGMGTVEENNSGNTESNSSNAAATSNPSQNENGNESNENVITNDAEASVKIEKNTTKVKPKEEVKAEQPVEQKASQDLLNALAALRKNKGGSQSGGDGNSGKPGNEGDPNGGPGDGNGGPGGGPGEGGFGPGTWKLSGRKMIGRPAIIDDSQEEGKVIVAIVVNEDGRVISADPGQRGSTTTSTILWAKARQAALSAKFNPSPDGAKEQRGTMTFNFVLN